MIIVIIAVWKIGVAYADRDNIHASVRVYIVGAFLGCSSPAPCENAKRPLLYVARGCLFDDLLHVYTHMRASVCASLLSLCVCVCVEKEKTQMTMG